VGERARSGGGLMLGRIPDSKHVAAAVLIAAMCSAQLSTLVLLDATPGIAVSPFVAGAVQAGVAAICVLGGLILGGSTVRHWPMGRNTPPGPGAIAPGLPD